MQIHLLSVLTLLNCTVVFAADKEPRQPNIVLIVADDLGYQDLGCCGTTGIKTPHIDRLAKEGVRATSFYVTWPACTPSRGSLLTGRYPQRNGLYDMIRNDSVNYGHKFTEEEYAVSPEMTLGLDVREITLAQILKQAGYATGVIGKWDSGRARRFLPLQRGFDFFYGFANTGIDYWTHERYGVPSMFRGNERIKEEGYATQLFQREALEFIDRFQERPFLLYLPFNAPHAASNLEKDSFQVPAEFIARYSEEDPKSNRTKYRGMVSCLDAAIGEIVARLEKHNLMQKTLILLTSDNGGTKVGSNGPLHGAKGQLFEGGVRVPLIAHWPKKLPAGRVTDEFLTTLEMLPTFVEIAGANRPAAVKLDGFNMLPVLQGDQRSSRQEMFWQRRNDRAARVGHYKWVSTAGRSGLFDLASDIGEQRDLSADRPELVQQLENRWQQWRREMDESEPRGPFRDY